MNWLIGLLIKPILDWLWAKLASIAAKYATDKRNEKAAEDQAAEDMKKAEALTPDSSIEEQRKAADDAFSHL